ncbi:MAG TPA: PEP-CTERM sorting domain-containing protein [Verrucomicrobiae bacterium]|jgi:hypothetical protein
MFQLYRSLTVVFCLSVFSTPAFNLRAASINVPNASFESPSTPPGFPAYPVVDSWQKFPQQPGIPLPPGITWDQLAGVFPNTPVGSADHIDNMTGNQGAYMFNIPGVGLFQDLSATYQAGNSYNLTVGILGGDQGMPEGSSLLLGLYYRDGANNMVPIGSLPVTFTAAAFPNTTHFFDYQVQIPGVLGGDAWAGKGIGVEIVSTFGTGQGDWVLDNVRLDAVPEPSTVCLLGLGTAAFLFVHLRGRSRKAKATVE